MVMAPAGRIGSLSAGAFARALAQAIASGERRLVVDFERVDYISGAGLQALDQAAGQLQALKREIVFCALCEPVRLAFDLAGFLPRFAVEPSRESAIARP
jgi:anti-anti-sigma factor